MRGSWPIPIIPGETQLTHRGLGRAQTGGGSLEDPSRHWSLPLEQDEPVETRPLVCLGRRYAGAALSFPSCPLETHGNKGGAAVEALAPTLQEATWDGTS